MKKLSGNDKAKLIYTIELLVFACLFAVLGILFLTGILHTSAWKKWLVLTVGTLGAVWCYVDFFWCLKSPKRRAKNSLLDKALVLPNALYAFAINIYFWVKLAPFNEDSDLMFAYCLGASLCYFSIIYLIEAFYHWKHPVPGLIEIENQIAEEEALEKGESAKENEPGESKGLENLTDSENK